MKKLLLISAFLIFTCSSESEDSNINSNTTEKKILSIEIIEDDDLCKDGYNYSYTYDNDNITLATGQYYLSSCLSQGWTEWEYNEPFNTEYQYFSDKIVVSNFGNNVGVNEVYFDDNGLITGMSSWENLGDYQIIFDNGYINKLGVFDFEWQDGNIIRVDNNQNSSSYVYTYSNISNKTSFILRPLLYSFSFIGENIPLYSYGLYGEKSSKLPISQTQYLNNETVVFNYDYILDDEGYPIYININEISYYENENSERNYTLKLTYTN
ncbi:hypothetical protein N9K85_03310 [Flavobacteriaceae bacterium]|nr:hypothetical protein [Flavobacteriaceae bacterium]MDB2632067.1 hypothetical protein [Flavobacteriaceae bacterium]